MAAKSSKRKDRLNSRERELAAFTHCEQYLVNFIKRHQRPRRQLPNMEQAAKEIGHIRLTLLAEVEGEVFPTKHLPLD